jgi:hypothetical protein
VPTDVSLAAGELRLLRGGLDVRVRLAPFAFEVRRGGRRIVREGGARVWDGVVHDQFIALTEGVIAGSERPSGGLYSAACRGWLEAPASVGRTSGGPVDDLSATARGRRSLSHDHLSTDFWSTSLASYSRTW